MQCKCNIVITKGNRINTKTPVRYIIIKTVNVPIKAYTGSCLYNVPNYCMTTKRFSWCFQPFSEIENKYKYNNYIIIHSYTSKYVQLEMKRFIIKFSWLKISGRWAKTCPISFINVHTVISNYILFIIHILYLFSIYIERLKTSTETFSCHIRIKLVHE